MHVRLRGVLDRQTAPSNGWLHSHLRQHLLCAHLLYARRHTLSFSRILHVLIVVITLFLSTSPHHVATHRASLPRLPHQSTPVSTLLPRQAGMYASGMVFAGVNGGSGSAWPSGATSDAWDDSAILKVCRVGRRDDERRGGRQGGPSTSLFARAGP